MDLELNYRTIIKLPRCGFHKTLSAMGPGMLYMVGKIFLEGVRFDIVYIGSFLARCWFQCWCLCLGVSVGVSGGVGVNDPLC